MRIILTSAVVIAAVLPVAGALWLAGLLLGRGPVACIGLMACSAAINALWPLGGGNGAAGTLRMRLGRWEWTVDADREPWRARLNAMGLAALVTGGFVLWTPLLALAWRLVPAGPQLDERMAWAGVVALLLVGWQTHRPELPLRRMVEELEQAEAEGRAPERLELERQVRALAGLVRANGAVGHVGGIGALTPGLHEVLAAERLLRRAAASGVLAALPLYSRCLKYLAAQALPGGGFPAYPGGGGRAGLTARAMDALGAELSPAERASHRAFVESCRLPSGQFGRSPGAPPSPEDTRWAARLS